VYDTREDNLIIETPLILGSDMKARVAAKVRLAGYAVYIPAEVEHLQVGHTG
jgi:hypothetical protein